MPKPKVLFIDAHFRTTPPYGGADRLLLEEDVRRIRQQVRAAGLRDAMEFDVRWAVHTQDFFTALNETRPQVVHFIGHGQKAEQGLVESDDLRLDTTGGAVLAKLFAAFRGDVRVVVLNACNSLREAEAVAGVVGCAIRTRGSLSDEAAIQFSASFYRALALGHSVRMAFDQARTALALSNFEESQYPELLLRNDVDPARLVLVQSAVVGRRKTRLPLPRRRMRTPKQELNAEAPSTREIQDLASRVWENSADAEMFLSTPHALLEGLTPRAAARTAAGRDRVRRILLALEYGLPV